MATNRPVTVYNFHDGRSSSELVTLAPFKATRETIAALGGECLEGTAETVPSDQLDLEGRYQRIATGWGELA